MPRERTALCARYPAATAVICLAAFLALSSLPLPAWLGPAGLGEDAAQAVHAGTLAVLSLAMLRICRSTQGQMRALMLIGVIAAGMAFAPFAGFYLSWCLFTGLAEETLLCGTLLPCCSTLFSTERNALMAAASLFAICHVTQNLALAWALARIAFAFAFGICMMALYRKTRKLWMPVLCHAAFDAVFFTVTGELW